MIEKHMVNLKDQIKKIDCHTLSSHLQLESEKHYYDTHYNF